MSPLKISLMAALAAAVLTAGGLHFLRQARAREVRRLQAENSRLRLELFRRDAARRAEAPAARPSAPAADTGGTRSPAVAPVAAAPRMAEYYRNEGNATPRATLQTFAWACDRGDVETVGRLLHLDAAARPKAEAFMAGLPPHIRGQWKTVDEMAAAVLTRSMMSSPFPDAEILATATPEEIGPDRVRLRLPNVPKDGTEYQRTPEGWKYVLTEKVVDAYIRQATQPADGARGPGANH